MHAPPLLRELLEAFPEVSNKTLSYFMCHLHRGRIGVHLFPETFMVQKNILMFYTFSSLLLRIMGQDGKLPT